MRLLIVEDQRYPLRSLEHAVKTVGPKYFSDLTYEVAKCFNDAKAKLEQERYGIVLLDHRMPVADVGNLEETDFNAFSDSLKDIGYSLIEQIRHRNPETVIVGTSSLEQSELSFWPIPDYRISKMYTEVERDLESVLSGIVKKQ
jgi:CheY-like chemotaxis protein